jgi:hypothetical protein
MEALAAKRIEVWKEHHRSRFGPAHIAVVHARTGPLEFSAGVTPFMGIDSLVSPSVDLTRELWNLGKDAALEMYNDNAWDIEEVNLLATVIVDKDSPTRHMWVSSPGERECIEVVFHGAGHTEVEYQDRRWSFPIECGFNAAKNKLKIEESIRWN